MAHILDARGADGAIVLLGDILVLPASAGSPPVATPTGSLRRNRVSNSLEFHTGSGWQRVSTEEGSAAIYMPRSGGRFTGPVTFGDDVTMDAGLVVVGSMSVGNSLSVGGTVTAPFFDGEALSAQFAADLAERYHADAAYAAGTVLVVGGENEVTVCSSFMDLRAAGIVSTKCAYGMNLAAGTDETHPLIALKGRVPCKVWGPVRKGDLLVTSAVRGHAQAAPLGFHPSAILGRALADKPGDGCGVVEVMV